MTIVIIEKKNVFYNYWQISANNIIYILRETKKKCLNNCGKKIKKFCGKQKNVLKFVGNK
jgi:hypothetical protein